MMRAKRLKNGWLTDAIGDAVRAIAEKHYDEGYVSGLRAKGKARRMSPTATQAALLRYVEKVGAIPFEETWGMDWRYLGGLFTRGAVAWERGRLVATHRVSHKIRAAS